MQEARKKNKKGRAMGGMLMGTRKELLEKGAGIETDREGIVIGNIKKGEERWRIIILLLEYI